MAKVKITGHASGTGVITVTAPNTSTDRTITLPDSTGTILDNTSTLDATKLSGTLPALNGASLTGVNAVNTGRKNIFINGDFSVNQRGTGATTGGTYMTADRWKAGATTETFQTVANDRDLSIANMLKVTSHTNGYGIIVQAAEDVRTASGQNVTLSFWAKTANFSSFRLELQQNFGSGGSATVTVVNNASYFSVPDTGWNKYTATIAIPSISGKTVGTSSYLNMVLGPNSGTSGGITYYSEVQLELGSVATDFEHRTYAEELTLCQRYYQIIRRNIGCLGWAGTNGGSFGDLTTLSPPMRANATLFNIITPTYSSTVGSLPNSASGSSSSTNITRATEDDGRSLLIHNNATGSVVFSVKTEFSLDAEL